jgi:hypothetical protein
MPHLTESQFTERFASLVLGGPGLPKKPLDRHVLLISSILKLEPARQYSENELNDQLREWTTPFGTQFGLDHVTLRRYLIDEKYIKRDAAGQSYELATTDLPYTFDRSIAALDLEQLIAAARSEREKRKQQYMKTSKP